MNERADLVTIVSDWLQAEAPPRASERVLAAAIARVAVTPQRRTIGEGLSRDAFPISPTLRLALLGVLLLLALLGGALIAAALLLESDRRPSTVSYEAVFLRTEELTWPAAQHVVVGVEADGMERPIVWLDFDLRLVIPPVWPPEMVLSPTGLLAVPGTRDAGRNWHWEIVDLRSPQAEPLLIPGPPRHDAFWGPGDRLTEIWWEESTGVPQGGPTEVHWRVIDGRSGATETYVVDVPHNVSILHHWAADGSGLIVETLSPMSGEGLGILRPDGIIVEAANAVAHGFPDRRSRADGAEIEVSREIRQFASRHGVVVVDADGAREELLHVPEVVELADVVWSADGLGAWLATTQGAGEAGEVSIERWRPESGLEAVSATVVAPYPPFGSSPFERWRSLAPDDSMLVVRREASDGNVSIAVITDSGTTFEVEGWFAGWLEADR